MKTKKYTPSELKRLLVDFHNNHPRLGDTDEWYGDQARMTSDCICQFIHWIEAGDYSGSIDDEHLMDDQSDVILGLKDKK